MADFPCKNPHCKSYGRPHPNCQCAGPMAKGGEVRRFCDLDQMHSQRCPLFKGGFVMENEDDTHYVVKHPNGDTLKIAKKGLSPKLTEQIKKFAKGGEVKNPNPISEGFINATGAQGIKQSVENVKNYAGGGMSMPQTDPSQFQTPANQPPVTINIQNPGGQTPQPPAQPVAPAPQTQESSRVFNPQIAEPLKKYGGQMLDMAKAGGPMAYLGDKLGNALYNTVTVPNPKASAPPPQYQPAMDTQPYGNVTPLPPAQEPAQSQNSPALAMPSIDPEVKQMQQLVSGQQARAQEMHQRALDVLHDMNSGQIDFNRAWSNKSVPNKILAGIGMALSGIGSGITKQPNLAMEMINNEINRDIDQQKSDLGKKATVLDGYLKAYGNDTAATNAYREDLQALVAAKMQQYSLKMQGNMMRGISGGQQGMGQYLSYLRMTNPEMAKSIESRMIPTLGGAVADVPPTPEDRDSIAKGLELDSTLSQLEQFSKTHGGSLNPAVVNQGKALASRAKELLRQANKQGVFKESEQKFDETMIPGDPTKFLADFRTLPQYETMRQLNKESVHNTVGKYFVNNPLDAALRPHQLTARPGVRPQTQTQNVNLIK